ncbi:16S rRNA (cytidine(1402)-2'-O)-methyltransferase [Cryomorpha ignava]|uniref:Ribosomal RNA small subunit methyltransferase I n=1 Tax=Cryomorpha ignava TaxID=101383 RepID=A0A7K3WR42_9FLAO|nr:16S rRNA (cytidine(1402)-2'-O)-methyltransferase [Cryomorpha ignava]NEN23511.1 16S rRNA (cytidine(1402)-2'-O)-methyltransferase [Cryomorpha ignava]
MGKLILVPTPIGNLGDITLRALEVLKTVDAVLAEDTRTSGRLMKHFEIDQKLIPFHAHNEHRMVERIVERIAGGDTLAIITDAGSPGISDPGFLLVRACVEADIEVESLPGATAFIPALTNSGFPTDRFIFEGFLPPKKGRNKRLEGLADESRTIVFYESPHRIVKTLVLMAEFFGEDRPATVSRELTKLYEETLRGTLAELAQHFETTPPKGEMVIVIKGKE